MFIISQFEDESLSGWNTMLTAQQLCFEGATIAQNIHKYLPADKA